MISLLINSGLFNKVVPLCSFVDPRVRERISTKCEAKTAEEEMEEHRIRTPAVCPCYLILSESDKLRESILKTFIVVQGRALACLGNIICALPDEGTTLLLPMFTATGLGEIGKLWGTLFGICEHAFRNPCEEALQSILTTTMFSLLRRTKIVHSQQDP